MRFLLLARARTTGHVRLLSERAFDSQRAAVDAATATVRGMDLRDDEVFAVDLDSAGPVLVLRVETPAMARPFADRSVVVAPRAAAPLFGLATAMPAAAAGSTAPYAGIFAPAGASTEEPMAGGESPESSARDIEPPAVEPEAAATSHESFVCLQARFPLFGSDEDAPEAGLSETLRRVAQRMESDLRESGDVTWAAADDTWDARTLDDYALPDDTHLHGAREEGRRRIGAAELLYSGGECTPMHETTDLYDHAEAADRVDDAVRVDELADRVMWGDRQADGSEDPGYQADARDAAGEPDDLATEPPFEVVSFADALLVDPTPESDFEPALEAVAEAIWTAPAELGDPAAPEDITELLPSTLDAVWVEAAIVGSDLLSEAVVVADFWNEAPFDAAPVSEHSYVAEAQGEPAVDAPAPDASDRLDTADAEPAPYRASGVDFAVWVCADCVYQRTCRKAGHESPATCGTFQWRSF